MRNVKTSQSFVGLRRGISKPHLITGALIALIACFGLAPAATAQLARFGPIDPTNGFPAWYQDNSGLALDLCLPADQAETTWCLLPPIPNGPPEVFPTNWAIENFYSDASTTGTLGTTKLALIMDLENSFANGFNVVPGDQIAFARTRIRINPLPFSGTYTVYTPVGKFVFDNQVAGDRLFFTEDIGLAGVGDFSQALNGRIGPFLLPSATPGGSEVPPIPDLKPGQDPFFDAIAAGGGATAYPNNGRRYIADPGRIGPVTGGKTGVAGQALYTVGDGTTRDPNIFRVEGPNGFVFETTSFSVMGRIYEGPIAGNIRIDRASYARTSSSNKVDVYATASPSTQGRLPAGAPAATVSTQLTYFDAPCTATLDSNGNPGPPFSAPASGSATQMLAKGSTYYGQSAPATIPTAICVQANAVNSAGQTVPQFIPTPLGDQVFITQALYDPSTQSLSVKATSSDQTAAQTLTLSGFGALGSNGQLVVNPLLAPPATVTVLSTGTGSNTRQVSTGSVSGGTGSLPIAANDTATVFEDCSPAPSSTACTTPASISVLANDTGVTGGTVAVVSAPVLGTAVVNADGSIAYTPSLNASGVDTFTYNVTVGGQASNDATVTVTINPVNDAPTAVDDNTGAVAGLANSVNVLANDTDPDGPADLASAVIVSGNAALAIVPGTVFQGGVVTFTPPAQNPPGRYTFTYNAVDQSGTVSANVATVTVTLSGGEAIIPAKTQYTQSKGRWVMSGTVSPTGGQTITMTYVDGTYKVNGACTGNAAGTVVGTAPVVSGNFTFDQILTSTSGVQNPSNTLGNSTGFWCSPPRTMLYSSSLSSATATQAVSLK